MVVFDSVGSEAHPIYRELEIQNLGRQYDFVRSAYMAAAGLYHMGFSHDLLKGLNAHAIACLHQHAGIYRPLGYEVAISESDHKPPQSTEVLGLMNGFVDFVSANWIATDPVLLASFVLWRLNWIHPFVNGNGRTARAAAYFVLCRRLGVWLPGTKILPEFIRENREEYVEALKAADEHAKGGRIDVTAMYQLLSDLLKKQLSS